MFRAKDTRDRADLVTKRTEAVFPRLQPSVFKGLPLAVARAATELARLRRASSCSLFIRTGGETENRNGAFWAEKPASVS